MKQTFSDVVKTLVLAAALFFVVQALLQNFEVFGASMEPSVQSGEHILVNKAAYLSLDLDRVSKFIPFYDPEKELQLFGEPERGDVVVFKSPNPPPKRLIKRIVGLPGDTIEIRAGALYINGQRIEEPYTTGAADDSLSPRVVPEDHYFLLGDNRNQSNDSRNPEIGPVHRSNIVGKAWLSYWPLGDFGFVDAHSIEMSPTQ
ncbi:MAG: signal peptidase I [Dehalococcoidia bacterium]